MARYQENWRRCYPSKFEMNKKKFIFLLTFFIVTIIISYFLVIYVGKKVKSNILKYSDTEANRLATIIINQSVGEVLKEKKEDMNLLQLMKTSQNEIEIIDFNTEKVNEILKSFSEKIQSNLIALEEGKINKFELSDSLKGKNFSNKKRGIVCEIYAGSLFGNSLLASTGPIIPVKLSFVGKVLTSIKTTLKTYGINNTYLEVDLKVEVTDRITLPSLSNEMKIKKEIPIIMKIIQGKIPNYYNGSIEKSSTEESLPLTE